MASSEGPRGAANEARWAEVLTAAFEVFLERGYENATVQDIASRVGLLKGSLYYYIESKEALLFALIKRAYENIANRLEANEELLRGDVTTRLCRFIESFVGHLSDNVSEAEARLVRQEMHRLTPAHRHEIRDRAEYVDAFLGDIVRQGVADGDFDPQTDVYLATSSILSMLNNVSWSLRRGDRPWEAILGWYQLFMVRGLGGDPTRTGVLSLAYESEPLV